MSLSSAETYARRARNSDTAEEVGDASYKAIQELIRVIRNLESQVNQLESRVRALSR